MDAQKPAKYASFAGSFDIAPMIQYVVVCHIESSRPQKMYRKMRPVYPWLKMSYLSGESGGRDSRVYCLLGGESACVSQLCERMRWVRGERTVGRSRPRCAR